MSDTDKPDTSGWIASHDPLRVIRLTDPVIDNLGHDVRSSYVETYWLPILGPTAIWATRRMADWLDASPDGIEVSLAELGPTLGIGGHVSRNTPIVRTMVRLVDFGIASTGGDTFGIRTTFAPLPLRLMRRLPASLLERHPLELEPVR